MRKGQPARSAKRWKVAGCLREIKAVKPVSVNLTKRKGVDNNLGIA